MRCWAVFALLAAAASPASGRAEAPEEPARELRAALLAGGYLALTGPADLGAEVVITIKPGEALGRFGVRASARSFETEASSGFIAAGLTYEAAASRPRLVLDLFAEAGVDSDERVVAGGGVHTKLFAVGPIAIAGELAGHMFFDGLDTSLALSGSLLLGLAR